MYFTFGIFIIFVLNYTTSSFTIPTVNPSHTISVLNIDHTIQEIFGKFKSLPKTNNPKIQEFIEKKLKPIEIHTERFLQDAKNLKNAQENGQVLNSNYNRNINKFNKEKLNNFNNSFKHLKREINQISTPLNQEIQHEKKRSLNIKHRNKHNRSIQLRAEKDLSLFQMFEQCLGKLAELPASIYCMVLGCDNEIENGGDETGGPTTNSISIVSESSNADESDIYD